MSRDEGNISIFLVRKFLSGEPGWRLTDRRFQNEQLLPGPPERLRPPTGRQSMHDEAGEYTAAFSVDSSLNAHREITDGQQRISPYHYLEMPRQFRNG